MVTILKENSQSQQKLKMYTGFTLSCPKQIPGLFRMPKSIFQDHVVVPNNVVVVVVVVVVTMFQCVNIKTHSSYLLYI